MLLYQGDLSTLDDFLDLPINFNHDDLIIKVDAGDAYQVLPAFELIQYAKILGYGFVRSQRFDMFHGSNIVSFDYSYEYKLRVVPSRFLSRFTLFIWGFDVPLSRNISINLPSNSSSTGTPSAVASSATSVTLLTANTARKGATFWNSSTADLCLEFGATASLTDFVVKLAPGDYYELPYAYTGIVSGIWTTANGSALITELT